MTTINITLDARQVKSDFRGMSRRAQNFKPAFRWFMKELQVLHMQNFATRGATDGSVWKPLDPEYAAWKLENYGARGILVADGSLRSSLVFDNARGAVRDIRRKGMRFGTDLPYAKFHQTGTRNMPERRPLITNEALYERLAENMAEHITDGGATRGARALRTAASRFRSLFS